MEMSQRGFETKKGTFLKCEILLKSILVILLYIHEFKDDVLNFKSIYSTPRFLNKTILNY